MDGERDTHESVGRSRRRSRWTLVAWGGIGAAAIAAVLVAVAIWIAWPAVGSYPREVSRWLSASIGQRVSITSIEARWEGVSPRLELHDVTLLDTRPGNDERALARFGSLDVLVDVWASILSRSLRLASVTVHGASMMLIRHPDGSLDVQGIQDEVEGAKGSDALARLILGQARVSVRSSRLLWVDRSGTGATVSIRDLDLYLESEGERRYATVSGVLGRSGSGRFDLELDLEGNLLTPAWSGAASLNAQDLDLAVANAVFDIAGEAEIAGRANLDLTGRWHGGRLVSAQGGVHLRETVLAFDEVQAFLPEATGRVELHPVGGLFVVESGTLEWTWPEFFDRPVTVSAFSGNAGWQRESGNTRVVLGDVSFENAHLQGSIEGSVDWREGRPDPVLGVSARIARADLAHLPLYLPSRGLNPDVRTWLSRAIDGGHLEDGEVRIEGALGDWPFDEGQGKLDASARVSGVDLHYSPAWPSIEALAADLRFEGRRAEFSLSSGQVHGAEITGAKVRIPRMGSEATIEIEGKVEGSTEQAADFLRNSPLAPRFRTMLDTLEASGPAGLELRIALPLPTGTGDNEVSGRLEVRDNRSRLPGVAEGLAQVNGVFSLEGTMLRAEGVEALYLGRPVTLRVEPSGIEGGYRIEAQGSTTRPHLAHHLHNAGMLASPDGELPAWLSRIDGESAWRGVLELRTRAPEHEAFAHIRIASELEGARIDLPSPIGKAPGESVRLDLDFEFDRKGARILRARYGELLSSVFRLRESGEEGARLARGAIRFGGGEAELPGEEGLIVNGSLPRLSLGEWTRLLRTERGTQRAADAGDAAPVPAPLLRRVNLQVDEFEVFGVPLGTTRVDATADASSTWSASVVGANLLGEIRIPATPDPVLVHMDRLVVPGSTLPDDAEETSSLFSQNPVGVPAFRFTCAECRLSDRLQGSVDIVALPDPDGIRFQSFYMRGEGYETRGSGAWLVSDGIPRSTVDAEVQSDDLGRLLAAFGHVGGESISGATEMLLSASWPGSPFDFDLRRIDGVLHFRASEGRLTQVRRGATGRFFGLLMLPSLPRRLALDFRDFFQAGLTYDLMEGSFAIESGDAYTNNFLIESPTATIELAGRTGIVDEDYDHVLTLTPKLSENIALLPIWLGERILNTRFFDRAFAHYYSIRGPWSAPEIEPIPFEDQPSRRQRNP